MDERRKDSKTISSAPGIEGSPRRTGGTSEGGTAEGRRRLGILPEGSGAKRGRGGSGAAEGGSAGRGGGAETAEGRLRAAGAGERAEGGSAGSESTE